MANSVSPNVPGLTPSIDYLARDFPTIFQRALAILGNRISTFNYNALIATDVAPAILAVLSWFHEQNAHYYNRAQRNSLLELADTREAMVPLARAIGYEMSPGTSASVAVQATVNPPQPVPVTLPKGTKITVAGLTFEVAYDAVIPPNALTWPDGTTTDLIVLTEGATISDSFQSNGLPFQKFTLSQPSVIEGSVSGVIGGQGWDSVPSLVFVEGTQRGHDAFEGTGQDSQTYELSLLYALIDMNDEDAPAVLVTPPGGSSQNAVKWLQVSVFTGAPNEYVLSQSPDGTTTLMFGLSANGSAPPAGSTIDILYLIAGSQRRYQLTFDPDGVATAMFGDGVFGAIPSAGATITFSYRVGGGVAGNVPAGAISATIQGLLPNGATVGVQLTNVSPGSGGEDPETVDHARFFAPKFAVSNERAVTTQDWTTLAATFSDPVFGSPSYASAYLKQDVPELNTVEVAVWSRDQSGDLAPAGVSLKAGILNFLNSRRTITTVCELVDGRVMVVDISADITLEPGQSRQTVFAAIQSSIQSFFASSEVLPGVNLSISKLYAAIQNTAGVAEAIITKVVCSQKVSLVLGAGDGATTTFSGTFQFLEGSAIVPTSVTVVAGEQSAVDDGNGGFTGSNQPGIPDGSAGNSIAYVNGRLSIQFAAPPDTNVPVTATARAVLFVPVTENLGGSNGLVQSVNGATQYYPIVQRAPRGVWSGDPHLVIDSFRVAATSQFHGFLARGVNTSTLTIRDSGGQTLTDNGAGLLTGAGTGTVNYITGEVNFTFTAPPTLPVRANWTTNTVTVALPADYLPLVSGRVLFWGGFDADGTQPGAELLAYDDGTQAIAGNVLPGGLLVLEDGQVSFAWNTIPPPGPAGGAAATATLVQAPDGVRTTFDFTTGANFSPGHLSGQGRLRLQLSDLSTPGVTFADAYDNWQGGVHGPSLNRFGDNLITYVTGVGRITFSVPPAAGAATTFVIQVTNVAVLLYSAFVFSVKTPSAPGLDAGLFADNNGRFWGPPGSGPLDSFPTDSLDFLRGRYKATLASGFIPAGRQLNLSYDAIEGVPPALDIVVGRDQIATPGQISLEEVPAQIQGLF